MTAIHTCPDSDSAFHAAAMLAADALGRALAEGRNATLVLPGGTTVRHFLAQLQSLVADWHRITVILADDRWVAADDPASNEGLLRRLLPGGATVIGLKTDAAEPASGLAAAADRLRTVPQPFDVVFLGVGSDGHVASLFPHGPELAAEGMVAAALSPLPPHQRITLTLGALQSCGQLITVMADDKRDVLERALKPGPSEDMPIRFLLRQQRIPVSIFTA